MKIELPSAVLCGIVLGRRMEGVFLFMNIMPQSKPDKVTLSVRLLKWGFVFYRSF